MNKKELRLGNFVTEKGENYPMTVVGITEMAYIKRFIDENEGILHLMACNFSKIAPIDITKDWLSRLGYLQVAPDYFTLIDGTSTVRYIGKSADILEIEILSMNFKYRLEYVHQLQNAYFAITGKELELENQ